MSRESGNGAGSHGFFAAWMLLHEKADDWLKDALKRANETPGEARRDYQNFLIDVDREKEALKSVFADAVVNELKNAGFMHKSEREEVELQIEALKRRIAGLEEKLERLAAKG